jgi:hypothetical protein
MGDALRWETRAHARKKVDLFYVSDERGTPLQYKDKLVLLAMPMKQSRLATR